VKRSILCLVGLCLLALFAIGCGSNSLKTINLTASTNELKGEGATVQLQAIGNYSYGPPLDMSTRVTYAITADGFDLNGFALPAPPANITVSSTGLLTAVDPFVCTFAPANSTGTQVTGWVLTGSYKIVASFGGVSSQPFYVGMASAAGDPAAPANGACGP
jgi:hypothetical protein